jgi:flagellar protein FliL
MGKLIPLILGLVGLGAGVGAGVMLHPDAEAEVVLINPCGETGEAAPDPHGKPQAGAHGSKSAEMAPEGEAPFNYVKLDNQFVVPLVRQAKVGAMVVVTLSLEVTPGHDEEILGRQPKLTDAFLSVLFDHANAGGFDGAFTSNTNMAALRGGLREAARKIAGARVNDVLITGVVRQEV